MPLEPESDLRWAAFLYVSGDLDPVDEAAFEGRLADDQAAREAVADAVELIGAVGRVGSRVAKEIPRRRRPILRAVAWTSSVSAAACLAFALLPPSPRPPLATAEANPAEVARTWVNIAAEAPAPEPIAEVETEPEIEDAPADRALPSWLLSAASIPHTEAN